MSSRVDSIRYIAPIYRPSLWAGRAITPACHTPAAFGCHGHRFDCPRFAAAHPNRSAHVHGSLLPPRFPQPGFRHPPPCRLPSAPWSFPRGDRSTRTGLRAWSGRWWTTRWLGARRFRLCAEGGSTPRMSAMPIPSCCGQPRTSAMQFRVSARFAPTSLCAGCGTSTETSSSETVAGSSTPRRGCPSSPPPTTASRVTSSRCASTALGTIWCGPIWPGADIRRSPLIPAAGGGAKRSPPSSPVSVRDDE